jgi:phenylpropionate dioxygenase-like ring-hydroxylating dioxygenase large terminal subunit
VFVNFDKDAAPLESVLDPLPRHFKHWRMDECYMSAHVGKLVPANWKAVAEAFIENHHVAATHPQISPYTGDANSQYDTLSDHVTRAIAPYGYPRLLYEGAQMTSKQLLEKVIQNGSKMATAGKGPSIPDDPNLSARRFMGDAARANVQATGPHGGCLHREG